MVEIERLIIDRRKIKIRKNHICHSCLKTIKCGSECIFEKIIDIPHQRFLERRRHLNCTDTDQLKTNFELDNRLNIKNIISEWNWIKQRKLHETISQKRIN